MVDVFRGLGYNGSLISRVNKSFIFDQPHQAEYMERRCAFLSRFLPQWKRELGLRTALDVGCVVGYFSAFLRDTGFQVTAVDGREENIAEARSRHSGVEFRVCDCAVEDQSLRAVSCYPTEPAIAKMAFRAGFPHVYRFREFPDHEQFRRVDGRDRVRTLFAAATCDVRSPLLEAATEPFARPDRLTKERKGLAKLFRRLGKGFRRPAPAAAPTSTRAD